MKNKDYIKNILAVLFFLIVPYLAESVQAQDNDFYNKLSDTALSLTKQKVIYDPAYREIPYPNGDVPSDRGVCTDVVIRSYRKRGIDLQKEVHEDMKANFSKYPNKKMWGLKSTDTNIDHRRVPNLEVFLLEKENRCRLLKTLKTTNPEILYLGD